MTQRQLIAFLIIVIGCILRMHTAILHLELVYPDEQFQTLEPASSVVFGFGWKAWEWYHGTRSWFVPGLYMPLLWILKQLGIVGGPLSIQACRVLSALVNTFVLFQFWRLLEKSKLEDFTRLLTLCLIALSSSMVVWGATTFSDTWAFGFLWLAMPNILDRLEGPNSRASFVAGLLLGLSFLARIQMIFWAIGLALTFLLFHNSRTTRIKLAYATLGYCVPVLFQGALDKLTWGHFFHSTIQNYQYNIVKGVAAMNGVSPWYDYFPKLWTNGIGKISVTALIVAGVGFALTFATKNERLRATTSVDRSFKRDWMIILPGLFFLGAHLFIGHKETRFILPMFPSLYFAFAKSLNAILRNIPLRFISVFSTRVELTSLFSLIAVLTFASTQNIYSTEHYAEFEISELTKEMAVDQAMNQSSFINECVLLINHYWISGRGEMIFGKPIKAIEAKREQIPIPALKGCRYAIFPSWIEADFVKLSTEQAPQSKWMKLKQNSHGILLYKNDSATAIQFKYD